jgi:hypothetical protein
VWFEWRHHIAVAGFISMYWGDNYTAGPMKKWGHSLAVSAGFQWFLL